jgi:hypothetical protein
MAGPRSGHYFLNMNPLSLANPNDDTFQTLPPLPERLMGFGSYRAN